MSKRKTKDIGKSGTSQQFSCSLPLASRVISYTSLILLGLVMLGILFPLVPASSHAEEVGMERAGMERVGMEGQTATEFSSSVHTDIKSYVRSSIALSITGQVNLDLIPKAQGAFSTESAKLSVSTNNVSGYSVYLAMVDSQTNSLLPMNTRSTEEIMATPAVLTAENYQSYLNTWGYKVAGDAGYQAVPRTAGAPIITAGTSSQTAEYDLSFAVAVGADLPAGVYGNQVLVSTIANPIEIRGINDITFMQEMTSDICLVSFENETKQLIDTRDGKSYWVAKLKDGNCWMVQNLALDLSTDKALTPADSDVRENYKPTLSTNVIKFEGVDIGVDESSQHSWNLGKIVLATPTLGKSCGNYGGDGNNSATSQDFLPVVCAGSGFVDVSSDVWESTYTARALALDEDGKAIFYGTNATPIDITEYNLAAVKANDVSDLAKGGEYDAHYLIGNYYSWPAATAGGKIVRVGNRDLVEESICPRGWTMTSADKNNSNLPIAMDGRVTYYELLHMYGYPSSDGYGNISWGSTSTPLIVGSDYRKEPLYLTASGYIAHSSGYLRIAGSSGNVWSNTKLYSSSSFYTYFDRNAIGPAFAEDINEAASVRCVAK